MPSSRDVQYKFTGSAEPETLRKHAAHGRPSRPAGSAPKINPPELTQPLAAAKMGNAAADAAFTRGADCYPCCEGSKPTGEEHITSRAPVITELQESWSALRFHRTSCKAGALAN